MRIVVSPPTLALSLRDSLRLSATLYGASGATLPGRALTYATDDATIATVNAAGVVVGVGRGVTRVHAAPAERPEVTAAVDVRVAGPPTLALSARAYDDTSFAVVPAPLVATVADSLGAPMSGVEVVFSAPPDDGPPCCHVPARFAAAGQRAAVVAARTDVAGRAAVTVQLPTRAGAVALRVEVRSLGLRDSVAVAVRPASPARIHVAGPRDTAVYAGVSLPPFSVDTLTDVWRNPVPRRFAWALRRGDVLSLAAGPAADADTARLVARALGRAWLVATAGRAADSVAVSVVPRGELAARSSADPWFGTDGSIYRFALDGSGYRRLGPAFGNDVGLRWTPGGDRLVLHQRPSADAWNPVLFVMDTTGKQATLATPPDYTPGGNASLLHAEPLRDGRGVAAVLSNYYGSEVWEIGWNGRFVRRLGPAAPGYERDLQPSVSPDGALIALYTNRGRIPGTGSTLQLYDVAAGTLTDFGVGATRPRWSPDGRELVYIAGSAKGPLEIFDRATRARRLVPSGPFGVADALLDWSPDGAWILVCAEGSLSLVHHVTGERLPLAFTGRGGFCEASWRPGS